MTRESFLILLGIFVVVSPFAGLPLSILSWALPIIGLLVILIGAWMRRDRMVHVRRERETAQQTASQ